MIQSYMTSIFALFFLFAMTPNKQQFIIKVKKKLSYYSFLFEIFIIYLTYKYVINENVNKYAKFFIKVCECYTYLYIKTWFICALYEKPKDILCNNCISSFQFELNNDKCNNKYNVTAKYGFKY